MGISLLIKHILDHMNLIRNLVDIVVQKVIVCLICEVRTVKVCITFC